MSNVINLKTYYLLGHYSGGRKSFVPFQIFHVLWQVTMQPFNDYRIWRQEYPLLKFFSKNCIAVRRNSWNANIGFV